MMSKPQHNNPDPELVDASFAHWEEDSKAPETLDEDRPPQFGMKAILILPVILAVSMFLFQYLKVFGVLVAFFLALIVLMVPVRRDNRPLKWLVVDLLWGVILPVLCLMYDPVIFHQNHGLRTFAYLFYGSQMLFLLIWLAIGRFVRGASACFAGALYLGMIGAGTTALILLPFSLVGILFMGLGVLGFTPLFTADVFARNANLALQRAREKSDFKKTAFLVFLGIVLAIVIPGTVHWAGGDFIPSLIDRIPRLSGSSPIGFPDPL